MCGNGLFPAGGRGVRFGGVKRRAGDNFWGAEVPDACGAARCNWSDAVIPCRRDDVIEISALTAPVSYFASACLVASESMTWN